MIIFTSTIQNSTPIRNTSSQHTGTSLTSIRGCFGGPGLTDCSILSFT